MPKSKTRFRMPRRITAARTCDPCRVCNTPSAAPAPQAAASAESRFKEATAQLVFLTSHLSTASQTTKSVILSEAKDLSVQF